LCLLIKSPGNTGFPVFNQEWQAVLLSYKNYFMRYNTSHLLLFSASVYISSCVSVAPVNNHFEKAGTLQKGNVELAGHYTTYSARVEGESEPANDNVGFRIGYGVSDKFDLKFRYERLIPAYVSDEFKGANYISIVPKISLKKNTIAFLLPFSYYFYKITDEDARTTKEHVYSIAPQFLFTHTNKSNKIDLTGGVKGDFIFNGGSDFLLGASVGAGFSKDLRKWAIRPEIGFQFFPGDEGRYMNYGLGFQVVLSARKQADRSAGLKQ
jgi:hypothetical protein